MATIQDEYTATAGQVEFPVTFERLKDDNVLVTFDGEQRTDYTVSGSLVTMHQPSIGGEAVVVQRRTPIAPIVNFESAGALVPEDVWTAEAQPLFLCGEDVSDDWADERDAWVTASYDRLNSISIPTEEEVVHAVLTELDDLRVSVGPPLPWNHWTYQEPTLTPTIRDIIDGHDAFVGDQPGLSPDAVFIQTGGPNQEHPIYLQTTPRDTKTPTARDFSWAGDYTFSGRFRIPVALDWSSRLEQRIDLLGGNGGVASIRLDDLSTDIYMQFGPSGSDPQVSFPSGFVFDQSWYKWIYSIGSPGLSLSYFAIYDAVNSMVFYTSLPFESSETPTNPLDDIAFSRIYWGWDHAIDDDTIDGTLDQTDVRFWNTWISHVVGYSL